VLLHGLEVPQELGAQPRQPGVDNGRVIGNGSSSHGACGSKQVDVRGAESPNAPRPAEHFEGVRRELLGHRGWVQYNPHGDVGTENGNLHGLRACRS
jgi:hypothetical protein